MRYNRAMHNVLVLGSGRSGTSLVAGTLAGAGYHLGDDLVEPRDSNPKGFFESRRINTLNETLLQRAVAQSKHQPEGIGRRHYWLAALPDEVSLDVDPPTAKAIETACVATPFCYKDPRFCYTLDAWRPYLPDPTVFVCVFREPAVTAASICREVEQARYLAGVRMTFEQAVAVWSAMYGRILEHHRHRGRWLFLHASQLLESAGLDRLAAFTGAALDRTFPEKRLQRTACERPVALAAQGLFSRLCDLADHRKQRI